MALISIYDVEYAWKNRHKCINIHGIYHNEKEVKYLISVLKHLKFSEHCYIPSNWLVEDIYDAGHKGMDVDHIIKNLQERNHVIAQHA